MCVVFQSDGNTSFLRAARAGHLDKVLEQLRNNVDINTSNANGLNALHLASKDGHVHVVTELLKRGANVDSATKKGNTALHIASLAGQEEVVRLLVEHGASVNVQSQNGFTPLYMAAQENHDNVVKYLLANGANQSLATEDGFTPLAVAMQQGHDKVVAVLLENDTRGKVRLPALHIAAKKDDCKAAALLLQNEHNPDVTSKSGFTPLHIASHYGNEGIANLLLNKGADVNYSAKHNITPLHVAAKWGKSNMVSLLLEKGANIESKTRDGLTPLHCAARSGHEQVVDMLLERGAPISCKTKNGLAPLHMSSQGDHVDAARILLYHRAPVDEVTVDYLTALHVAAHCGHARVAKLLLDRKADPNARALNGFTPLHIACKKNRIKVVELLLKHGASIEATTESGLTPLHVASFMGCMNIVIYLLQNEANPDVPTVRGETPLHLAARANQTDIIRILLRNGAQVDARAREQQTPLHIAARLGNVDIVMLLLQHGAAVDCTTKDLYSALHIAAKEGQDEVAAVLLENGASPTATTKKGFTPLHLAAKYGNMKVARLLLQRDAPVDAQGKNGVTPLHVASHYDHQNVALLLLDKGASPHATAKNGHTPLHIAAKKNQMDIATTLLEYGAKANAESKAGFTPLHLSAQEGHIDMSSLLLDHQADTNHKAKNGLTPLHLCAQEDRVSVASVLVKNGAEIDTTTKAGYTPLHVACHFGQLNMVRFLLDEGSKVSTSTAVGYTPLHQAAQQGHCAIINTLLEHGAPPNATTNQGQTALSIAQKLGYISVVETLKGVTEPTTITPSGTDEKYKVVSPETMQETFMSDSEDEGGEDTLLSEQPYRYLTVDEMKSLGDDSLPIDVRQDERIDSNRECMTVPPTAVDDTISPQHLKESYSQFTTPDNIDISKQTMHVGFLVSFLVDARGGAMRGCRHSGVRVIVPPRRASMPMRVTCRYLKRDKLSHPPPLMEGEALASRILELGPVGAKFLGPVMIEVPHFGSLRGKEREIVILRSDNGETWREHTVDCSEEAVQDVLSHSFDKEDLAQLDENARTTRILTTDFPHYFAVVTRVRQEVHAIGPEGGMVSSSVVPQVQAVFPQGALTKKIKVGLQAQPISAELAAKLLGNRVAVSPIVTVEPRRRKFHKPITLTIPKPQAANKGMINQYSGDAPTLRLLCSITGGTTRAQWEDVTGSTPFTFVNDCVSFTTTVSARFWLMDCRNVGDATKMATELYREAIHVPFMAKFVVFAKRVDPLEARLRIFCMTDDKEDKTLEHQEHFTEVAKSRDVEVLEGKTQYVEFAGNLVPVTKSGEQLQLGFRAFRENRLPFTVRVKDQHADCVGRTLFMREARLPKGEPPQQPICVLNIVLPDEIIPEAILPEHELHKYSFIQDSSGLESYKRVDLRLSDISNLLGSDWVQLADELGVAPSDINRLKSEHPHSVAQQGLAMLRLWVSQAGNKAQASTLESALSRLGRDDIVQQCVFNVDQSSLHLLKDESRDASIRRSIPYSDKDFMKDSESVEDLSRTPLRKTGDIVEKDDKEERKYEAEEKEVEEIRKSVSERRKEIEKRLSLEKPLEKRIDGISEKVSLEREDLSEKEIAEEKRVSSPDEEPSELSFEQKRLSFEQGKRVIEMKPDKTTMKEVKERADERFLAEERKAAEALQEKKSTVEETTISFQEKRKSFEQGLKEEKSIEKEDLKKEDVRKDSALFEGVSQGLVRLDAAFTAAPQVQDLLSPKVSKTPPPSPAEFKDITGTVAWTEEPAADTTVKAAQSQDWADKGKPDSTIELSKKGTSRVGMKKDIEISLQDNANLPLNNEIPQQTTKNIESATENSKDKDSKYQFTMSVPDKKSFTETMNSITTFLESEKNYNNKIIKIDPSRLTAVADTEVSSSDETEESRSESDQRSDKSFVGKMSKRLFGVFKKDDKSKSEKKRGKKKKLKNERNNENLTHAPSIKTIEPVESSEKIQKVGNENSTSSGDIFTPKQLTDTDHEEKLSTNLKETFKDFSVPDLGKKVKFEGIQTHTHEQIKDATDTLKEIACTLISEEKEITHKPEDYTTDGKFNIHLEDKSNKEMTQTKIGSETVKTVNNAENGHTTETVETKEVYGIQSEYKYSKSDDILKDPVKDTNTIKHTTKEIELMQPLNVIVSDQSTEETHNKLDPKNEYFFAAEVIPDNIKTHDTKQDGEIHEFMEKRKVTFSTDNADEIKRTTEDFKRKSAGVTFAMDVTLFDTESKSLKEGNYGERDDVPNNKDRMSIIADKNIASTTTSIDEGTDVEPSAVFEKKQASKDISIPSRDGVKGPKEKKKSFFGALFGKSGETSKVKKGEITDAIEKSQFAGDDVSENFENTQESKISIDKQIVKEVKDVTELLDGYGNSSFEGNITENTNLHGNNETSSSVYESKLITDEVDKMDKEEINIPTSINTANEKIQEPKEQHKLSFSTIFGKHENALNTDEPNMASTTLAPSDIVVNDKVISTKEDWNIVSNKDVVPSNSKPIASILIDNTFLSKTSGLVNEEIKETKNIKKDINAAHATENADTKKSTDECSDSFSSNISLRSEQALNEIKSAMDNATKHTSKNIVEEMETSSSLAKDLIEPSENVIQFEGSDALRSVTKISKSLNQIDNTISGTVCENEPKLKEESLKLVNELASSGTTITTTENLSDLSYDNIGKNNITNSTNKPVVKANVLRNPEDVISDELDIASATQSIDTGTSNTIPEMFNTDKGVLSGFEKAITSHLNKSVNEFHNVAEDVRAKDFHSTMTCRDGEKDKAISIKDSTVSNNNESVDDGKSYIAKSINKVTDFTTEKVVSFLDPRENDKTFIVESNMKDNMIPELIACSDRKSEVQFEGNISNVKENLNNVESFVSDPALHIQKPSDVFDPTIVKVSLENIKSEGVEKVVESTHLSPCVDEKDEIKLSKTQYTLGDVLNNESEKTECNTCKAINESSEILTNTDLNSHPTPGRALTESGKLNETKSHEFKYTSVGLPSSLELIKDDILTSFGDGIQQSKVFVENAKNVDTNTIFSDGNYPSENEAATSGVDVFNKLLENIQEEKKTMSEFVKQKADKAHVELKKVKSDKGSILDNAKSCIEDVLCNVKDKVTFTDEFKVSKEYSEQHTEPKANDDKSKKPMKNESKNLNQEIPEDNVQKVTNNSKSNDDKLNNILIDMLIEQESTKTTSCDTTRLPKLDTHQSSVTEQCIPKKSSIKSSEIEANCGVLKGASSFGKIESLIKEVDLDKTQQKDATIEQPCIVTTPTMQRRRIGGSQRLSREERPALRDVSHIIDYSSSEEEETNYYIVTEPSDRSPQRKVVFHVESEDETFMKVSDSSSEPEVEFTEIIPSPDPSVMKQGAKLVEEGSEYFDDRVKSKIDSEKNIQKVERRFERMASETLDIDPVAKYTADREFQRMVSQLSNEEVDACLSQWEEGGLTPSEELDSTKDTIEGDIDPDVEALPEASIASTNPFYSMSSQWVDFEHDINDVPSSIFWAFDTMPTSTIIQPSQLDIPIKTEPDKGESAGEETSKSPAPTSVRESEEALLDMATGLHDAKGSSSDSGPSSAK